jgi:adenylate cyclase
MSQTQPLCILFADVSGSTKLFEQRGDVEARAHHSAPCWTPDRRSAQPRRQGHQDHRRRDHVHLPGRAQRRDGGQRHAARVAHDINFVRDNLGIRIGLHHGETLVEDNDVYGDAVNTAARMASLAKREQIVTTATTLKGLTNVGSIRSRSLGRCACQRQAAADRDRRRHLAGRHLQRHHGAARHPHR